ncbi:MAG: hypothetical protein R2805_11935 [Flavobacterium sp.]|jgi:hypothetical protein|uniref:hypothetical protein n=1 Tax=Flavobacterium sp. TaxID=239 RepID=UPI002B61AA7E|nr:hypothetical protein [Flavobacterium sp.]HQA74724.1 hypothetical protein [Flavobacterium sp.]
MKLYYIDRYPNQDNNYELHIANCNLLPNIFNRACLGNFDNQEEALLEANKKYPKSILCTNCLKAEHNKAKPFFKRWFQKK